MNHPNSQLAHSIGMFDSGVGGLSVLRAIRALMPEEPILYLADQENVPYGSRSLEQVRKFSVAITNFLIAQGAKLIIVACNTASAAALNHLRAIFPKMLFVGMEPAVKPAAGHTQSGLVGVLATPATFQGELYASVIERYSGDVEVLQHTCPGLVDQIEKGNLVGDQTRKILEDALGPMLDRGIDTVVLGCTHYPFVIPLIEEIVGDSVRVIDPAWAVAKQTKRLLEPIEVTNLKRKNISHRYFTSGDIKSFKSSLKKLRVWNASIEKIVWESKSQLKIESRENKPVRNQS